MMETAGFGNQQNEGKISKNSRVNFLMPTTPECGDHLRRRRSPEKTENGSIRTRELDKSENGSKQTAENDRSECESTGSVSHGGRSNTVSLDQLGVVLEQDTKEDVRETLQQLATRKEPLGGVAASSVIPQCLERLDHLDLSVRASAMQVITQQLKSLSIVAHIEKLCKQLTQSTLLDLKCGQDNPSDFVSLHTNICSVICDLQAKYPDKLMPHFRPISQYLLEATKMKNDAIATAACNYWATLRLPPVPMKPTNLMELWIPAVMSKLPRLIPAFINCMVYKKEHVANLEALTSSKMGMVGTRRSPEEMEACTNLRNFAALGLENICRLFQKEVIPTFRTQLKKWLYNENWLKVEAMVLAIGAFTEALGTPTDMQDTYGMLMPRLLDLYSHERPLVRSITCFTMQHFINLPMKHVKDPYPKMLRCTLSLLRDNYCEVQEMALQSLALLLRNPRRDIAPYAKKITEVLIKANLYIHGPLRFAYYECIAHVFGRVGVLLDTSLAMKLADSLITHWESLKCKSDTLEDTQQMMQLCQPLCVVAKFSPAFGDNNGLILEKVAEYMQQVAKLGTNGYREAKSDMVTGQMVGYLDLTSAMFEGQRDQLTEAIVKHNMIQHTLDILSSSKFDESVQQSALALLGHMCINCYTALEDKIDSIISILTGHVQDVNCSIAIMNNTLWALSFVINNCDADKGKELQRLTDNLLQLFMNTNGDEGNDFPGRYEKANIFYCLCDVLTPNVRKIPRIGWMYFCIAAAFLDVKNANLNHALKVLLQNVRSSLGDSGWKKLSEELGSQCSSILRRRYRLY
ncbi:hypothetical protein NP493_847g01004 [Ridgeia piscesae]|uniref:Uncharacterized protein n=1 Tax=Ridgeia piscesae TaxID=27915 RepID=A0AAD9KLN4_RIDPI|nr:hypothetical protein NP493_847g01004 [Ridgeia piscesae]